MADTRIPMMGNQFEAPDMLNALAKAQNIKAQQMDMQSARAEGEGRQRLNALYQEAGGDFDKMRELAAQSGNMDAALMAEDMVGKRSKSRLDAEKAQLESARAKIELGTSILGQAQDQASYTAALQQMAQAGIDPSAMPKEYNPQFVEKSLMKGLSMKDQIDLKYKQMNYDLSERKTDIQERRLENALARPAAMPQERAPTGYRFADDGSLMPIKGGPADKPQAGQKTNLSATAQKELFEADDMITSGQNVVTALDQALQLNDKAYSGYGASERAAVRSNLPGESEEANATVDMNNIITGQALESLKATFGGMPTEGERKILLELQASVEKTPTQRKAILQRAKEMATRRIEVNRKKADALRGGTYMTDYDPSQEQAAPVQPAADNIDDLLEMYK